MLSALISLGQHDEELLFAMEKHLPGGLVFSMVSLHTACLVAAWWLKLIPKICAVFFRADGNVRSGADQYCYQVLPENEVPL